MSGRNLRWGRRRRWPWCLPPGRRGRQQRSSTSSAKDQSKDAEPVVRTFGSEGGFRTEVTSRTKGTLTEEDRRQASLLMAEVFEHIDKARDAIDADDPERGPQGGEQEP